MPHPPEELVFDTSSGSFQFNQSDPYAAYRGFLSTPPSDPFSRAPRGTQGKQPSLLHDNGKEFTNMTHSLLYMPGLI